jgi:hypothetical protein
MVLISYPSPVDTTSQIFTNAMWVDAGSPQAVELGEGWLTIGASAFKSTAITSVTIPESVTEIGSQAFNLAENLASVTFAIDGDLLDIGYYAFKGTAITSINIPASVKYIGDYAFFSCPDLASVTFTTGSLLTIGSQALSSIAITSITIPASVTYIANYAFYGSTDLGSVTFDAGSQLTTIGGYSQFTNSGLTTFTAPSSVLTVFGVTVGIDQTVSGKTGVTVILWQDETAPVITSGSTGTSLVHHTGAGQSGGGQTVYTIEATDAIGVISYEIDGIDASLLSVNSSTGVVTLNAAPNYGSKISFSFTVTASDAAGNTSDATTVTFSVLPPPAPICFPAGTPVLTDQGEIAIEKIDPKKHTIRANKIEGVTETTSIENYVVMIKKDAFSKNVPCRDTTISANHKIVFNNQMVQAREFVGKSKFTDKIYKVDYTGYTLYNVLLENKHDLMAVNNIIAETLNPNSVNAWLFRKMKSNLSYVERKEVMDAYMQRAFPSPTLHCTMIGCK